MRRLAALLAVALLVTAGVAAATTVTDAPSSNSPGAQLAGVVGVQAAEVEGEVASRALAQRLAAADSNASRAAVIAAETENARAELERLRERRAELRAAYQNGSISEAVYRAKLARIAAQARALERQLNRTTEVATRLPAEELREHGVNVTALRELRRGAAALNDGSAAAAARAIAGEGVGNGLGVAGVGPPEDRGPDGNESGNGEGPPDDVPGVRGNSSSPGSPGAGGGGDAPGGPGDVPGAAENATDGATNATENTTDDVTNVTDDVTNTTDGSGDDTDTDDDPIGDDDPLGDGETTATPTATPTEDG